MLIAIIFIAFIIVGCSSLEAPEDEYIYSKISIEKVLIKDETGKITDTIKINHRFTTEIHGWLPNTCWEVYKIDVQEFENEFKITPMSRMKKSSVCLQIIVACSASVDLIARTTTDTLRISAIGVDKTITKTIKVIQE